MTSNKLIPLNFVRRTTLNLICIPSVIEKRRKSFSARPEMSYGSLYDSERTLRYRVWAPNCRSIDTNIFNVSIDNSATNHSGDRRNTFGRRQVSKVEKIAFRTFSVEVPRWHGGGSSYHLLVAY